jgi:release factor glutamine methyltransferase
MGTGSGILGVIAAGKAHEVVAVDVNPYAVRCAKVNAALNNARSKMAFLEGDMFKPFNERARFDLILFNAPYLPIKDETDKSLVSFAWKGGETGRNVIDSFIREVSGYLNPEGRVLLMQSNFAGVDETMQRFTLCGMCGKILVQCKLPFFETLFLIEAKFAE